MYDQLKTLNEHYDLTLLSAEKASVGAGSDTYFINCTNGKYVVKFPSVSEMNNPSAEPELCNYLLEKGISVCRFIKATPHNLPREKKYAIMKE